MPDHALGAAARRSPGVAAEIQIPRAVDHSAELGPASTDEQIARIVRWMDANIEKAPVDVFSALDVLEQRKAEC